MNEILDMMTQDGDFPDELFVSILRIKDPVENERIIAAVRRKAKSLKRLREFDKLFKAWITKSSQELLQQGSNKTEFTDAPIILYCKKYVANDTGIKLAGVNLKTGEPYLIDVCPHPILPTERYINIDTGVERIKIDFFKDNEWKSVVCECNTLYNKSAICGLANRGIIVTSENSKDLVKYISEVISLNIREIPLYRSTSRLGWINTSISTSEFSPYSAVKYDGDDSFRDMFEAISRKGDYKEWRKCVIKAVENKVVRLIVAASFASVLLEQLGVLPFIVHLWGTTGGGKTVALMIGASFWGNPKQGKLVRTMDMTVNSLARTAAFLYNLPFFADELQTIKQHENNYDRMIMKLTEGIDRGRATAYGGGIEEMKTWKNCFIFSGEEPITKDGSGGGVKNRVIEIEIGDKIIENGNEVVSVITQNYGFAGEMLVKYIISKGNLYFQERYKSIFKDVVAKTGATEKQAMAMSALLLADSISCETIFSGLIPLQAEDVTEYTKSAKNVDVGNRAYEWVLNWIAENEQRFFKNDNGGVVWGKIDTENNVAFVSKNILVEELKKVGFDYYAVTSAWTKLGFVQKNSQGKNVHQTKVYGIKASYLKIYLLKDTIDDIAEVERVKENEELPF